MAFSSEPCGGTWKETVATLDALELVLRGRASLEGYVKGYMTAYTTLFDRISCNRLMLIRSLIQ